MRFPRRAKLFLRNMVVLLGAALPLLILLLGLLNRGETTDVLGEAVLLYVGLLGPTVIGGVLYLLPLFVLTSYLPQRGRLIALVLTPLIALGWVVFGLVDFFAITSFAISFTASVIVYGMLVKLAPTAS